MEKPFLLRMVLVVGYASHFNIHHIDGVSLKCDGVYSILIMQFLFILIITALFRGKRGFQRMNLRDVQRLI
jgi:hypothetical protein